MDPEIGEATPQSHRLGPQPTPGLGLVTMLALSALGWGFLVWLALDMGHPLAQLTMPMSANWSVANLLAIWLMWALMMAAMMLPSALPMGMAFTRLALRAGAPARLGAFIAAYLLVWMAFSVAAGLGQWAAQAAGWVNPMIVSTSAWLNAVLLLIAGIYQFSPLKSVCLSQCRSPMVFLLGEWRPGVRGAFTMGWRHGLLCVGCCWALMLLLFVGGVMNLPWVLALALAVAIEKLAPGGARIAHLLGALLIGAGLLKVLALLQ